MAPKDLALPFFAVRVSAQGPDYPVLAVAAIASCSAANKQCAPAHDVRLECFSAADSAARGQVCVSGPSSTVTEVASALRYLSRSCAPWLYESLPFDASRNASASAMELAERAAARAAAIDSFLDCHAQLAASVVSPSGLRGELARLNGLLDARTFLVGNSLSLADLFIWGVLRGSAVLSTMLASPSSGLATEVPSFLRWYNLISSQPFVEHATQKLNAARNAANKCKKDQGRLDVELPGTTADSVVVTRFPPEPSGFMHIGHAKALLLNEFYARKYKNGSLILRFDDTNPTKESVEFEQAICEDVARLGVKPDRMTRTSDHFETLLGYADKLIKLGLAYVDDTDRDTMRKQRNVGEASKCRELSVEENLRRWEEMKKATPFGLQCCLRGKVSVDDANKALRDPVFYRCCLTPHHITKNKYLVYPTYDFACPIVDAVEGVTHALRTSEYRDRCAQYQWVLSSLKLPVVHVIEYSRLNFVYTLLSKRKLTWFVTEKKVDGWDDPRFPTVRGILRRGLTVAALRSYVLMQGASLRDLSLEWDKLWALNRKEIDSIAPRHVVVGPNFAEDQVHCSSKDNSELHPAGAVSFEIEDGPRSPEFRSVPRHPKNHSLGEYKTAYSSNLLVDAADVAKMTVGEEITLKNWGNAIITKIDVDPTTQKALKVRARLNLDGNVQATKLKVTWVAKEHTVPVVLKDYDYLITKRKLEETDSVSDFLTPCTEFTVRCLGDANLSTIARGAHIQLERRGFYVCDKTATETENNEIVLVAVPDGKATSVGSKHVSSAPVFNK